MEDETKGEIVSQVKEIKDEEDNPFKRNIREVDGLLFEVNSDGSMNFWRDPKDLDKTKFRKLTRE